jgi:hypothetical protein
MACIERVDRRLPSLIEIMDLSSRKIIRRMVLPAARIETFTGRVLFPAEAEELEYSIEGNALVPCLTFDGSYGMAVLDMQKEEIREVIRLGKQFLRVLGIREGDLVYLSYPDMEKGGGISLHFYDLRARKEVKCIDVHRYLTSRGEEQSCTE